MLVRILVVGVLVIAALAAVKNGWVLRQTGLLGSCTVAQTTASGAQWELCKAGRLDGRPDLGGQGCSPEAPNGELQYWSCPAPLGSSPSGV